MKDLKEETKKDLEFMQLAINEAKSSKLEKGKTPLYVGAVVVKDGKVLDKVHRGEIAQEDHAEYTLLERNLETGKDVILLTFQVEMVYNHNVKIVRNVVNKFFYKTILFDRGERNGESIQSKVSSRPQVFCW